MIIAVKDSYLLIRMIFNSLDYKRYYYKARLELLVLRLVE